MDVFICHTSADKADIVHPLHELLSSNFDCWIDDHEIRWGDSVTQKVNDGLRDSRFVIAVLTANFVRKNWPIRELNSVLNQEASSGNVRILPLVSGTKEEVDEILAAFPLLGDKLHMRWPEDKDNLIEELSGLLGKDAKRPKVQAADSSVTSVEWHRAKYFSSCFLEDGELLAKVKDFETSEDCIWYNAPQIYVRLRPATKLSDQNPHSLRKILNLQPLGQWTAAWMEPNKYGAVAFTKNKDGVSRSFSQVFVTGEIWGVELIHSESIQNSALALPYIHKSMFQALEKYSLFSRDALKLESPYFAEVGIAGIEGFGLFSDRGRKVGEYFEDQISTEFEVASSKDIQENLNRFNRDVLERFGVS